VQYPFSCVPVVYAGIEATLSAARVGRYLAAAKGDKHLALRLYVWNARICEAFYLPLQLTEVVIRNHVHAGVLRRYGPDWPSKGAFACTLPSRLKGEMEGTIRKERVNHGTKLTINHVVAGLSFGFWTHLLTKNYDHLLWKGGVHHAFKSAPPELTREKLHTSVERIRAWRNRIAHHFAIFDKGPTAEYQHLLQVARWTDLELEWLIRELSHVSATIGRRPRV